MTHERLHPSITAPISQPASIECLRVLFDHQIFSIYCHEVDHGIALKHGGQTTAANLVLACLPCNRHKGSDLTSLDPMTGEITPLFNPRTQNWSDHFKLEGGYIIGLTASGRTTIFSLKMNEASRLQLRQALVAQGLYPELPRNFQNA